MNTQFLVRYPKFENELTKNLDKTTTELQNMRRMPPYRCCPNFTDTSSNDFKVEWFLKETKLEISFPDKDLNKRKQEESVFLKDTEIKKKIRYRGALLMAAAKAGTVEISGLGFMFGESND